MNEPSRIFVFHMAMPKLFLVPTQWDRFIHLSGSGTPGHQYLGYTTWNEYEIREDHALHLSSSSKE